MRSVVVIGWRVGEAGGEDELLWRVYGAWKSHGTLDDVDVGEISSGVFGGAAGQMRGVGEDMVVGLE